LALLGDSVLGACVLDADGAGSSSRRPILRTASERSSAGEYSDLQHSLIYSQ
jgi:hypothetical protein